MLRVCFVLLFAALFSPSFAAHLVINQIGKAAQAIVYDLPESSGRAEVIRFLEAVRDRFNPKIDILDAAATSESVLKEKLKQPFLLYTTLGSKSDLFQRAVGPLHWTVHNNEFRWGSFRSGLDGLRVIAAAKHAYANGHCVVYAAGSNASLAGINVVFHGPYSYHIYRGTEQLKQGRYDQEFRDRAQLEKGAALQDVEEFFATLERVHPKLLAKRSQAEYVKLQSDVRAAVNAKADGEGNVPMDQLASQLAYAAAWFQDGHTTLGYGDADVMASDKRYPPFRLRYENGRWILRAASDPSLAGTVLKEVNGSPVEQFLRPVLDRCSGETAAFRAVRFRGMEAGAYVLANLTAEKKYKLKVRGGNTEREVALDSLNYRDFEKLALQAPETLPNRSGTTVDFLEGNTIAYFQYQSFQRTDEEKNKIDGIFEQIRAKGARDLILDLRGNGGGNSDMGEHILKYLYEGAFRPFSEVRAKLSPDVKGHVAPSAKPGAVLDSGKVVSRKMKEKARPKPAAFFNGRSYLLIDSGTFSSATDFAAMFRDYKVGTIIGYETGGLPTSFGDMHSFTLKNSGIRCGVSWKQFFGPRPRPGDDEHGVQPDVSMNEEVLKAFRAERDPVLAFTVQYVREKR